MQFNKLSTKVKSIYFQNNVIFFLLKQFYSLHGIIHTQKNKIKTNKKQPNNQTNRKKESKEKPQKTACVKFPLPILVT